MTMTHRSASIPPVTRKRIVWDDGGTRPAGRRTATLTGMAVSSTSLPTRSREDALKIGAGGN